MDIVKGLKVSQAHSPAFATSARHMAAAIARPIGSRRDTLRAGAGLRSISESVVDTQTNGTEASDEAG
jgi:hypothetical protein